MISCFFLFTLVNMVSQMLHRFGFIRLILTPSSLKGIDNGPRMGIGICICCQHPLQIIDSEIAISPSCQEMLLWRAAADSTDVSLAVVPRSRPYQEPNVRSNHDLTRTFERAKRSSRFRPDFRGSQNYTITPDPPLICCFHQFI